MNRAIAFGLALTMAACFTGAQARADDRKEIDALYAKLAQALRTKNADATLSLETHDFTAKSPDGKLLNGKQLAAQMKQENADVKSVKAVNIKVKSADIKGKTAKVTSSFDYVGEVEDKQGHMGPKGKTHVMSMSGEVKNDLVKTASGWKFKTMQQVAGKMMMDGKPFNPGGAAPHK